MTLDLARRAVGGLLPTAAGLLVFGVVILLTVPRDDGQARLHGAWDAVVTEPGAAPRAGTLRMPGTFATQGVHGDAHVRLTRRVTLPPSPGAWALHL